MWPWPQNTRALNDLHERWISTLRDSVETCWCIKSPPKPLTQSLSNSALLLDHLDWCNRPVDGNIQLHEQFTYGHMWRHQQKHIGWLTSKQSSHSVLENYNSYLRSYHLNLIIDIYPIQEATHVMVGNTIDDIVHEW